MTTATPAPTSAFPDLTGEPRIAYFSMEIALRSEIPTYSGGLGVLAGDTMRSSADLGLPLIGVTLVSRAGYFRQQIVDGRQVEQPQWWEPLQWAQQMPAKVAVQIGERPVWVAAWLYTVESGFGPCGRPVPVLLLDTDVPENHPDDRTITHQLYGGDQAYRLKQEMVLGIGGVRMLRALGVTVRKFHLNEGHAALLTLELLATQGRRGGPQVDTAAVRRRCVFTTHTPVEAGHDRFSHELAGPMLGGLFASPAVRQLGGEGELNMTLLALNLSEWVNGVARRHAEVSRRMFPGYDVQAITNGVHARTWTAESFARLFDTHVPGWGHEPETLVQVADRLSDAEVTAAHREAKAALLEHLRGLPGGAAFDPAWPILGYARRMTPYKRPELLFTDLQRLKDIATRLPFQIVVAGKAHPRDDGGRRAIEMLHGWASELQGAVPLVFVPDYNMDVARRLVSGADVWLNTPRRPLEASGTSGMKAALNGVPNLSVPDGWWLEGCIEGVTGWSIGGDTDADNDGDARALYDKLEQQVLPLFHRDPAGWCAVMKGAISRNGYHFNSHRMMRRYAVEAYLR
ncbi:alpha-glucan family phosphorylase [Caldimonas brevitalea]|uniref:glycogen phosphorylase n=1 Tax=Caldimonas brevitalea TaxID=413882 RepID=A0A0G3BHC9_9BURK|nr:alpha-glucan family phosphorylase [Caldimonas brevitalea]AKJ27388.1 alpha-glucan phosphorylase [Caldimonas brevitalea]